MRMRPEAGEPAGLDFDLLRDGLRAVQAISPTARAQASIGRASDRAMPAVGAPDMLRRVGLDGTYAGFSKLMTGKLT